MASVSPIRDEHASTSPGQDASAAPPTKKRRRAPFVLAGLLIIGAAVATVIYLSRLGKEKTDDAQVEAHVSNVSARIPGQVKRVLVADNQEVKPGDVLVELDDRDQQAKLTGVR